MLETVATDMTGNAARRLNRHGRDYLVVPVVSLVPGVLSGSKGALYYPPEETGRDPGAWDGMPVVVGHPVRNGLPVSARSPEVTHASEVGRLYKSAFDGKLRHEAWLDIEALRRVSPGILTALEAGGKVEVSTGLFTDNEPSAGKYLERDYAYVARNYRPDHLALLPDSVGACSVNDGCGINVNAKDVKGHGSEKGQKKRGQGSHARHQGKASKLSLEALQRSLKISSGNASRSETRSAAEEAGVHSDQALDHDTPAESARSHRNAAQSHKTAAAGHRDASDNGKGLTVEQRGEHSAAADAHAKAGAAHDAAADRIEGKKPADKKTPAQKSDEYDSQRRRLVSQLREHGQSAFRHETNDDLKKRLRKLANNASSESPVQTTLYVENLSAAPADASAVERVVLDGKELWKVTRPDGGKPSPAGASAAPAPAGEATANAKDAGGHGSEKGRGAGGGSGNGGDAARKQRMISAAREEAGKHSLAAREHSLAAHEHSTYDLASGKFSRVSHEHGLADRARTKAQEAAVASDRAMDAQTHAEATAEHEKAVVEHTEAATNHVRADDGTNDKSSKAHGKAADKHFAAAAAHRKVVHLLRDHPGYVFNAEQPSDDLDMSPAKACQILRDGEVHGKSLTDDQRKMFGAKCGQNRERTDNEAAEEPVHTGEANCEACMNRQQTIDFLTTNCDCWKGETDKEVLNTFSDDKLESLRKAAEKARNAEAVANAAKKGFTDPGGNAFVFNEEKGAWEPKVKEPPPVNNSAAPAPAPAPPPAPAVKTREQWLAEAPEDIRAAVQNQMARDRQEKVDLVARLVANVADDARRKAEGEWLMTKGSDELQRMVKLLPAPTPVSPTGNDSRDYPWNTPGWQGPNYAGAAGAFVGNRQGQASKEEQEDILPIPTLNWEEIAAENRKLGAG